MGAGVDARVVSALLTGINRAFPYVDGDAVEPLVEKVSPALFAIAHSPNLGGALQALALLLQLLSARAAVSDRFYRALYAVLLHPGAPRGSSAAAGQLLSLTFRSLKDDPRPPRAAAVVKRLLQVAAHAPAPFACGALMLVSEFLKQKPSHWDAVRQPREGEEDDDVERFVDADDDDDAFDETRVASKRKNDADADADADSDSGDRDAGVLETRASLSEAPSLEVDESKAGDRAKRDASRRYDMSKRDPLYARADASCWWELSLLERNVHPSVAAMARSLLGGFSVEYSGDPLADMTLASFLDKWLQKKPKRLKQSRGGSETMAKRRGESGTAEAFAPGTREFAALAETEVDPSEVFFHRYYSARAEGADGKKKKKKKKGEDLDGDGDDGDGDSASDDDDAVAERRAKKAARAGIEGFDAEEDEADSDAEDVDLGDFEEDASDDEPSGARRSMPLAASGIDPKAAGFGDYDSDEDAAADREERREEEAADADAYRYDALVDAYGEKPGYLRRQMEAAALAEAEAGGGDDSDSEGSQRSQRSEGSEGSEEEDDGVKVWEYEGSGSEEAVSGEDGSDGDDDDGGSSDDGDEDLLDDAPEASDSDPAVTLTAAAPRGGGKGGADAFASLDDYRAMIDADFAEHPPARSDDEDDGGDGEEEKRSSAKKKRRAPGAGETASAKKSKKASPALTRGAAARRKK